MDQGVEVLGPADVRYRLNKSSSGSWARSSSAVPGAFIMVTCRSGGGFEESIPESRRKVAGARGWVKRPAAAHHPGTRPAATSGAGAGPLPRGSSRGLGPRRGLARPGRGVGRGGAPRRPPGPRNASVRPIRERRAAATAPVRGRRRPGGARRGRPTDGSGKGRGPADAGRAARIAGAKGGEVSASRPGKPAGAPKGEARGGSEQLADRAAVVVDLDRAGRRGCRWTVSGGMPRRW
jgi:hypothetical protein